MLLPNYTQEEEVHILVYRGSLVRTSVAGKHCDALCQVHEICHGFNSPDMK